MANLNNPRGFEIVKVGKSDPITCYAPASDSAVFGVGDPVIFAGSADANGIPSATIATAGATNLIDGFITQILPCSPDGKSGQQDNSQPFYKRASTLTYFKVERSPDILLEAQADEALTAADIGLNANYVVGTPSTTYGHSTSQIDSSSKATGATLQFKLESLADGSEFGAYNRVYVRCNTHKLNGQTAGV